jgi:hypothetical protein
MRSRAGDSEPDKQSQQMQFAQDEEEQKISSQEQLQVFR